MQIVRRLSVTLSERVVRDASNSVRGSNIQCREKSFAATVPSDSGTVKRKPKRVPKDERKEMVEAFVNKYRAMNNGKFPPTKKAMKEVGGSYYTIKKIVQELQYNSKMRVEHKDTAAKEASAGETTTGKDDLLIKVEETLSRATFVKGGECKDGPLMNAILLEEELIQNRKSSPVVEEILSDRRTIDADISQEAQLSNIGGIEGKDTNSIREAEAKLHTPIAADHTILQEKSRIPGSDNKDAAAPFREPELKTSSHSEEHVNNIKQKASPMENFKSDGLKQIGAQNHSPELKKPTRELSNVHKADTQTERKSSLWENLKSLADGIFNMWKK